MLRGLDLDRAAVATAPFGLSFTADEVAQADRLELWGTTLPADVDFTKFRLMQGDRLVAIRRIKGF